MENVNRKFVSFIMGTSVIFHSYVKLPEGNILRTSFGNIVFLCECSERTHIAEWTNKMHILATDWLQKELSSLGFQCGMDLAHGEGAELAVLALFLLKKDTLLCLSFL